MISNDQCLEAVIVHTCLSDAHVFTEWYNCTYLPK